MNKNYTKSVHAHSHSASRVQRQTYTFFVFWDGNVVVMMRKVEIEKCVACEGATVREIAREREQTSNMQEQIRTCS